jgi:ABC-type polysaccharide transport system permease subunit
VDLRRNGVLYLLFLPVAAYFIIFNYIPMMGVSIAFMDYKPAKPLWSNAWVGLANFRELFTGEAFPIVLRNTVAMALLNLTIGFIAPIILALLMSEVPFKKYRRTMQTVTYMPYFVAAVVVAQMIRELLASGGALTAVLSALGLPKQNWVANASIPVFWLINCGADIWQGAGFGTIVYMAAIAGINKDYMEAAAIDGANRWRRLTRITLPSILPLVVILFTLRIGLVFVTGFDKILLLYMPSTYDVSDVLTTYTYRMAFGSGGGNYGLSAASGLYQSVVATFLLLFSNRASKKAGQSALF